MKKYMNNDRYWIRHHRFFILSDTVLHGIKIPQLAIQIMGDS
jgi:hypothetical protein